MIWKFVVTRDIMFYGRTVEHGVGGKCLICDQDAEQYRRRLFEFHLYCSSTIDDKPQWYVDYPTSDNSTATSSFRPILLSPYQLNRYLKLPEFWDSGMSTQSSMEPNILGKMTK